MAVGDNVVDIYIPENIGYPGGNALNFSVFSKMLGCESEFIGIFGSDLLAKKIKELLIEKQVEFSKSKTVAGESGYTKVKLENGDRKFIFSNKGGVNSSYEIKVSSEKLNSANLIHFNANGNCDELIKLVNNKTTKILYDFSDFSSMSRIEKIMPYINLGCFSFADKTSKEIESFCYMIASRFACDLLCTAGSKGAYFFENKVNKMTYVPAKKINPQDTMGAGDAFITCFATEFFNSSITKDIQEILKDATDFAACQCMVDGSFGNGFKIPENN
ncbi:MULTISPECIES: PfkB family carbohydrate kinase [Liquorilactobacillus]|uniref:PfkB family carbohydrate kinase n=1 Tax=Liquorilactobacillus TaxID=2767888 RepID=UPI001CBAAA28|nr:MULTISPECIES: PfkB family carbohydrate kinase [Liquorilactobacillus]